MFRLGLKSIVIGAVLLSSLVVTTSEVNAFWGHYGYGGYGAWCGGCDTPWGYPAVWGCAGRSGWNGYVAPCAFSSCSPCISACGPCAVGCSPCDSGNWYLGYRPGPLRRLLLGHCRWYSAADGCGCADECSPCDACSACGGVAPGCPSCAPAPAMPVTPVTPAPVMAPSGPAPAPAPIMSPEPSIGVPAPSANPVLPDSTLADPHTSGLLTIWVPAEAKVTVNGLLTKSTGSRRQYVSYGLSPESSYKYEIRAEIIREGKPVVENRTVVLQGGSRSSVAFGFNVQPNGELASR